MRRLLRWAFRIVLGLVILGIVGVVAAILLLDTLTKEVLVNRLRARTGMEAKISAVHVGLLSPTFTVEGLKLYNKAEYGGSVCVDMPELHIEYSASALRSGQFHITLLRLNLAEVSIVVDKSGRNNFERSKQKGKEQPGPKKLSRKTKFTGIDVLNLTADKFLLTNLATGHREEIDFGIKNQITRDVKPNADLASLGLTMFSRSKATAKGDADMDLSELIDSLVKSP
ncbi:MAG TPA: AsmA family protein [Candidatus Cybelea sp.]|nr:AsmA family protein [Candidatus Cybelea sp.]